MAEVFASFDRPVEHASGRYHARAVGRVAADGRWEGWLEFVPLDAGAPTAVGPVESRQAEREDLLYWASGLSAVFLEGALVRALRPLTVRVRLAEEAASNAPAARVHPMPRASVTPEAVLDPFDVGGRSLDILRQELTALNRPRLRNVIAAYDLNPGGADIEWMSDAQLVSFIVTATEVQLSKRTRQHVKPQR